MMFHDEDALKKAARGLGVSVEDLEKSLKAHAVYERFKRANKDVRRAQREKSLHARQLEESRRERPDWCFCKQDGFEMVRDYDGDEVIGQITLHFGPHTPANAYQEKVYKCSRCGKKYIPPQPAWA